MILAYSILWSVLLLVNLCWAENVTLYLDDARFVTNPPNWVGLSAYSTLCGGTRWTNLAGQSVSLSFVGVAVTVNFFKEYRGTAAQITLDGADVAQLDTYQAGVVDERNCVPLSWNSSLLSEQNHTIKVTQVGGNGGSYVWMRSFVYMTAPENRPQPPERKSSIAGPIAGGVIGAIFLIVIISAFIWYRQRRSRATKPPTPIDFETSPYLVEPRTYHQQEPQFRANSLIASPNLPPPSAPSAWTADQDNSSIAPSHNAQWAPPMPLPLRHNPPAPPTTTSDTTSSKGEAFYLTPFSPPTQGGYPPSPVSSRDAPPQLSQNQLDIVQTLAQRNVPAHVLSSVMDSMVSGGQGHGGEVGAQHPSSYQQEEAPPKYQ